MDRRRIRASCGYTEDGFTAFRAVRRVPRPHHTDAARARRRRLRRRRFGRARPDGGRHRLAADSALAQSASVALRRVLSVVLARERRPRLAEPVHVFVLGDQHLDRRRDSADRRRVVAAPPLREASAAPRDARVRGRASMATIRRARCCFGAVGRCTIGRARLQATISRSAARPFTTRAADAGAVSSRSIIAPGAYAGVEWRYARRALVQLARYDNRADPYSFADGQWGWGTDFNHLAVQVGLPAEIGLVVQWMDGATEWLTAALPNGTRMPMSELRAGRVRLAVRDVDAKAR